MSDRKTLFSSTARRGGKNTELAARLDMTLDELFKLQKEARYELERRRTKGVYKILMSTSTWEALASAFPANSPAVHWVDTFTGIPVLRDEMLGHGEWIGLNAKGIPVAKGNIFEAEKADGNE